MDEPDPPVTPPRPARAGAAFTVFLVVCMVVGGCTAGGFLIWEVSNGYGRMNPPPRSAVWLLLGGIALMGLPVLVRVPRMVRLHRRIGGPNTGDHNGSRRS